MFLETSTILFFFPWICYKLGCYQIYSGRLLISLELIAKIFNDLISHISDASSVKLLYWIESYSKPENLLMPLGI
jgi:hypothetical protein